MRLEAIAAPHIKHRKMEMTLIYTRIATRVVADEYAAVSAKTGAPYGQPPALPAGYETTGMARLRREAVRLGFLEIDFGRRIPAGVVRELSLAAVPGMGGSVRFAQVEDQSRCVSRRLRSPGLCRIGAARFVWFAFGLGSDHRVLSGSPWFTVRPAKALSREEVQQKLVDRAGSLQLHPVAGASRTGFRRTAPGATNSSFTSGSSESSRPR